MPTVVQVLGAVLVVAALVMLAGPWWACLCAGAALLALGYLAERASGPPETPQDRRRATNSEGGRS